MLFISILIPLAGKKEIPETIKSIEKQNYQNCEILILKNDITDLPKGIEVMENKENTDVSTIPVREIFIRKKGKGNALNEGICLASGEVIAVVDADCVLDKDALHTAVKHFENDDVVAVGGQLLVMKKNSSLLEKIQSYEYMKIFKITRRVFDLFGANCLISGAFGLFRKSALVDVGGYDTNSVGEDMEMVLRLQDNKLFKTNNRIVYEPKAVCFTEVPRSFRRLLHQRDRWQRGLLDCLFKHMNMILNPFYGMLGVFVLTYQVVFELFGPVLIFLYFLWPRYREALPIIPSWGIAYIIFQFILLIIVSFQKSNNRFFDLVKRIPLLIVITLAFIPYQTIITMARFYGIITFHWRRLVW